jgi:hypothetical protein
MDIFITRGLGLFLAFLGMLGIPGLFLWLIVRKKSAERLETQKQILDKIGTGQEAIQFLASKEGKELFERLGIKSDLQYLKMTNATQKPQIKKALKQVIDTASFGFLLFGTGVGLLIAAQFFRPEKPAIFIWGALLTFAGIGSLIAAWISYHLSKKWGIIQKELADDRQVKQQN